MDNSAGSTTARPLSVSYPNEAVALPPRLLELAGRLRCQETRREVARLLAVELGAEELLLFIRDPELEVLLPAPGLSQILPRGKEWPQFLKDCLAGIRSQAELPALDGSDRRVDATACAAGDEAILVLLGGVTQPGAVASLCFLLPLIAAACQSEIAMVAAAGHAATAREAAQHAQTLARALDTARRELEETLREVREADRRKDEFLAMLGHELRNPLTSASNAVQLLAVYDRDNPNLQRYREVVRRQLQQLNRLVDDLLDISRVSRGKIALRREVISLSSAVEQALEISRPIIEARRHALHVVLPDSPLWVDADSVRLAQVFSNLLINAAKYTDPGGSIELRVDQETDRAVVRVRDTGKGLPKEQLERVFEPFSQFHTTLDRRDGGLGIGLALVRELVQMHGGSVSASSEGPGKGSEFVVCLPLSTAPNSSSPRQRRSLTSPSRRVLVVDDNQDAVETLAELLEVWGHNVWTAADGPSGLQAAAEHNPEVILLDIGLPVIDGYEVARRLRAMPGLDSTWLIALTGYGQPEDRQRALAAGFDYHLTKPLDPAVLQQLLLSYNSGVDHVENRDRCTPAGASPPTCEGGR